jgi:sugar-specific transcriptional regulator TrmB
MSVGENVEEALRFLGLSSNEVKAYITLLQGGSMTASEVSRQARIPYSKVYEALESLRKKGIVSQQRSRPVVFTPKPPDTAIDELRLRYEAERKEKEKIALESLMGIYSKRKLEEKPDIWILRGQNEILSHVKNILINCKSELLMVLPLQIGLYAESIVPLLAALKEKGAKIMILTSPELPSEALKHLSRHAELRVRKTMYGGGIIADEREVVLLLGSGKEENSPLAIWAQHPSLAAFAKDYFAFLWNSQGTTEPDSK